MIKLIQEFNQLSNSQQIYFLSLVEESFLLLEGIKSAKEKYLDKIGEDKFNELIEFDSSRNKKYLDWICKEYLNGTDIGRLRDDIKLFDEKCNKNLIQNKDIYSYDNIDELENILNQSPDISNTERKKVIKKNPNKEEIEILSDVKVLRNDDEYFIAEIHSWEDAKFYGKGTKWCISEKDNDRYWEEYYEDDGDKFIYVRDFKYPDLGINSDVNYKSMIQIPKGKNIYIHNKNDKVDYSNFECNIWDAKDKKHPTNVLEISNRFGLNPEDVINARIVDLSDVDFNTKEGIKKWLDIMKIEDYTINDNLTVDVDGDVDLDYKNLSKIPVQFGIINGDFDCSWNNLESLEGVPKIVKGDFDCSWNNLELLEGAPKKVRDFYCFHNNLKSLEGAPKKVRDFYCFHNNLKLLEGAPEEVRNFNCSNNNLESLKGFPEEVRDFDCSWNNLESLKGSPEEVRDFDCSNNKLKSLKGAPEKVRNFNCSNNNLESLKGSPEEVRNFNCSYNNLESLEGAPKIVTGNFYCDHNKLKSLEGAPEEVGNFKCSSNKLKSLEGAPKIVNGCFYCFSNSNLESLEGTPKEVGRDFYCTYNPKLSKEYLDNFDFSFVKGIVFRA